MLVQSCYRDASTNKKYQSMCHTILPTSGYCTVVEEVDVVVVVVVVVMGIVVVVVVVIIIMVVVVTAVVVVVTKELVINPSYFTC